MVRVLIPVAVVVFLLVSAGIARALSAAAAERGAIGELVRVEAKGDAAGGVTRLEGCDPACARAQRRNATRLRRRGAIRVLNLEPSTRFALGGVRAKTRVAW